MKPYLLLLIKNRLAAWNPASLRRADQSKQKAILSFVGYCVLALILFGMLCGLEYLLYSAFSSMGTPESSLGVVCLICTVLTLFTSFFFLVSALFFSRDVQYVSSLPITSRGLLLCKLTMVALSEAGISLLICLPTVILYGVNASMGALYYIKALLVIPAIPIVSLVLMCLLAFVLIRVSALWKRRESLTTVFSFVFMIVFIYFEMKLTAGSNSEQMTQVVVQFLQRQMNLLTMLGNIYPPVNWMTNTLLLPGVQGWLYLLLFLGVSVGLVALLAFVFGGSYQRLAIKQEESLARMNAQAKRRGGSDKSRTPLKALYQREVREIFSVPINATNCFSSAVVFPIVLIMVAANAGNGGFDFSMIASSLMQLFPKELYCAIATAIYMWTCSINMAASTAVSREGKLFGFFRTIPVDGATRLRAKLYMSMTISGLCAIPMTIILCVLIPAMIRQTLIALVGSMIFMLLVNAYSIERDVMHPRLGWKTETEAIKQNGQAAITMFVAMGVVVLLGGAFYGLTALGLSYTLAYACIIGVIAILTVLMLKRLFGKAARSYSLQEFSI